MKTNALFQKYFKILNEEVPPTPQGDEDNKQQEPNKEVDRNLKHVIKILTNAFIFNPNAFKDESMRRSIYDRIDKIEKMETAPVVEIVTKIKEILALNPKLRVESKTIKIINKYLMLMEQPADATDLQKDQDKEEDITQETETSVNDENDVDLSEIFPGLYQQLIVRALKHPPTYDELMLLNPIVKQFKDIDPEKIVEAIQNLLLDSERKSQLKQDLSNA